MDEDPLHTRTQAPEAGPTWAERAELDALGAVLDPGDIRGGKNRAIDRVQRRALAGAAGDLSNFRVLDFGCGTGRLSRWLVERGARVEGVDVTSGMIAVARNLVPQAKFHVTDGSALPLGVWRVLAPKGRLLAIEQVTESAIGRSAASAAYEQVFIDAGFSRAAVSLIRSSDSRVLALAQRFPPLSRFSAVAWLIMGEARRWSAGLTDGRYADALFDVAKDS
jgi:SAM-dependent methyltransferase